MKRELEALRPELQLIKTEVSPVGVVEGSWGGGGTAGSHATGTSRVSDGRVFCPSGPEVRHRAEGSGEPAGGRGGGAARPQTDGHDGEGALADGGGGAAERQRGQRGGSDRIQGGRR